jgi:hypothetical protein
MFGWIFLMIEMGIPTVSDGNDISRRRRSFKERKEIYGRESHPETVLPWPSYPDEGGVILSTWH